MPLGKKTLLLPLLLTLHAGAHAQTKMLSLKDVTALALGQSPEHRAWEADLALAKSQEQLLKLKAFPSLSFSEKVVRGNDPVYAFSSRLQQQRFQQEDFALNRLNRPLPLNNFTTQLSGNWLAFDSFRTRLERQRASQITEGTARQATRSDQQILMQVLLAYQGIQLALRHQDIAQQELRTAHELLSSAQTRVQAGLSVDADKLSAHVYLAQRQQEQIEANGKLAIEWATLEAAAGSTFPETERNLKPLKEGSFPIPSLEDLLAQALKLRPDLLSLENQRKAQRLSVAASKSALGPTLNVFGSLQQDRESFAGAAGNNWVAGAELRIDLLPLAKREQLKAERLALLRTQAKSAAAERQIQLEVTEAFYEHRSARQILLIARASCAQSQESVRILKDRYEAGLATFTELLRAEDLERESSRTYWGAVYRLNLSYANLLLASGTLNQSSMENFE